MPITIRSTLRKHAATASVHLKKKRVLATLAVVVLGGGYGLVKARTPEQPVRYVLGAATKGTLVVSITGSGQVSDENELDVKPSVQAEITSLRVKAGDTVKAGDVLATLDQKDAQKTVRDAAQSVKDAQLSLQSAQLSLQKLQQKDPDALLKAQNTLNQAKRALDALQHPDATDVSAAQADLNIKQQQAQLSSDGVTPQVVRDAINSAVSDVKDAAQDMSDARSDADGVLGVDSQSRNDAFEKYLSVMNAALLPTAESGYASTKAPTTSFTATARAMSASSATKSELIAAADAGVALADQMDAMLIKVQMVLDNTIISSTFSQTSLDSLRSTINADRSTVSSHRSKLADVRNALLDAQTSYENAAFSVQKSQATLDALLNPSASDLSAAQERVAEAQQAYDTANRGPEALDIAVSKNSVASRQSSLATALNRLSDAQADLADYTIKAPFDATVAAVNSKVGDQPTGGTTILMLLTKDRIAKITVNEVDATKVAVGQKATLTFDAVPDLSIAATVSQVDAVGTVSQGVVNYGVILSFDSSDDRIKPGMSVSASIVTDAKTDALLVPASAVQTSADGTASVQILPGVDAAAATSLTGVTSPTPPEFVRVQVGLSNGQEMEIIDGLKEGELVVTRTIQPSTATASAARSTTGIPGLGGGGVRVQSAGGGGFRSGGNATFISR